jgi:hypothetical protein
MSKAMPATTSTSAPAPAGGGTPAHARTATRRPGSPARQLSTPDLIARMWDTLEWHKTLQIAFVIAISGITIFLVLAGLGLLAHATGLTASWPVGTSISTGTVSYQIAHRQRQ